MLEKIILFLTEASITSLGYYENNYLYKTAINCCFYKTERRFNIKILKPIYKSRLAYKETMK